MVSELGSKFLAFFASMGSQTQIEISYPANYIGHRIRLAARLRSSYSESDRRLIRPPRLDVSESKPAGAEMMTRVSHERSVMCGSCSDAPSGQPLSLSMCELSDPRNVL
jgi:hypothetical protein